MRPGNLVDTRPIGKIFDKNVTDDKMITKILDEIIVLTIKLWQKIGVKNIEKTFLQWKKAVAKQLWQNNYDKQKLWQIICDEKTTKKSIDQKLVMRKLWQKIWWKIIVIKMWQKFSIEKIVMQKSKQYY